MVRDLISVEIQSPAEQPTGKQATRSNTADSQSNPSTTRHLNVLRKKIGTSISDVFLDDAMISLWLSFSIISQSLLLYGSIFERFWLQPVVTIVKEPAAVVSCDPCRAG